ncbi:MAG: PAS domain S-box protein [Bacillota bacterium]|nr:PAS domain S-box protein [Bacillota bacterium]
MNNLVEQIKSENRLLLNTYIEEYINGNKTLFTLNPDAIFTLDLQGHICSVNPVFEHLFGYTTEESMHMKLQMLFPIESLKNVYHYFQKASFGQVHNFDSILTTKEKKKLHLNITMIPISVNDKIVGITIVGKDITELNKKREEVERIEEFHRVLTDNVLDIILSTDLSGKILYVSPSCESVLGYTSKELIGEHLSILFYKDDIGRLFFTREKVLNKLDNVRGTYQLCKKDGSIIWIESISNPVVETGTQNVLEIVSVVRDITERIKSEEELWSRKKAFRQLVECSPDAVVIVDDDNIIFINETGVRTLGALKQEDIMNRSIFDFIHSEYLSIAKELFARISNGVTTDFFECKIVRFDSSVFHAEIKGLPTFFQNISAQYIIIRDITERKRTQELLLNSEKLTIAGQLAAGIAHEVRNPLTAIKGFLQLLKPQFKEEAYFGIIQSELARIENILTELLVLAKPQELKFEQEDIYSIIEEVKTLIDTQAIMNNIEIKFISDWENLTTIQCDKNQLKQVFINFLKNAIEAMPKGGTITIEIKSLCTEKIKIIFKDTGTGIPHHILKRIGEPFFTTKENGTGLGIMISKQIIENHNGSIHFWSDEEGTIIEVILPIK